MLLNPEAGSGWQVQVVKAALPKPITTDDGTFTSTVSEIDWSGGSIPVGQFGEFNVLAQGIPTGTSQLVFKAIQTYSRRHGGVVDRGPGQGGAQSGAPGTDDHVDGIRRSEHHRHDRGDDSGDGDGGDDVGDELAVDGRADPGRVRGGAQRAGRLARAAPLRA